MVDDTLPLTEDEAKKAARRERKRKKDRAYQEANRERLRASCRAYYAARKDRICTAQRAKTAARRAAVYGPPIPDEIKEAMQAARIAREQERQRLKQARKRAAQKAAMYGPPIPQEVRQANKQSVKRACNRRWYEANHEQAKARTRAAYDREKHTTYLRGWRRRNAEKVRIYFRAYYDATKDERRPFLIAYAATRRARKRGAGGSYSPSDLAEIYAAQRGRCAECRKSIKRGYHADHIIPLARGGTNHRRNIQLLCAHCNLSKHAKHPLDFAREQGRLL